MELEQLEQMLLSLLDDVEVASIVGIYHCMDLAI